MKNKGYRIMDLAYIRDGHITHTDESVILACLVHAKGRGRNSKDMEDLLKIMGDKNVDTPTNNTSR